MSNNDNLLEQLIIYEDLTKERELLNKELQSLSGKNDTDSITRSSEIEKLLNENNTKISSYDKDKLAKVERYFASEREFRRLSNEIKTIENLSKKGEEDLVEVRSAEGRSKKVYKTLAEEYRQLTEQKSSMRSSFLKEYRDIEKYTTITSSSIETVTQEVKVSEVQEVERTLPEAKNYKNMNDEEKMQHLEGRIQEIIASSKLPNMGKKSQVMYEGKRYNIPKAYRGEFLNLVGRLNALNKRETGKGIEEAKPAEVVQETTQEVKANKALEDTLYDIYGKKTMSQESKERFDRALDEVYGKDTIILPPKGNTVAQTLVAPINNVAMNVKIEANERQLAELINFCMNRGINLYPINLANKKYKIVTKKAHTTVKNKKSLKRFKLQLPKAYNLDLLVKQGLLKMQNKLLDKGIKLQDRYIKFKNNTIQKYNSVKNTVTSIPKRTSNYIKGKYNDFKKYFADKKEISRLRKEDGYTRKEAMEQVYADKKDKHLDYKIINRATKFKDNTCQRIKTTTGKIVNTTKTVANTIAKPFKWLRDNYHNEVKRAELLASKEELKRQVQEKRNTLTRVRTNPNMGGYVGTVAITVMGVLVLAGIIFMGIGSLINR